MLTVDKTREEVNFITTALLKNSLFSDISETSLKELVNGFKLNKAKRVEELVAQGDSSKDDYEKCSVSIYVILCYVNARLMIMAHLSQNNQPMRLTEKDLQLLT